MSNELKKSLETLLEINDIDLFKNCRDCKVEKQPINTKSVSKKKEKLIVLNSKKSTLLRRISPPYFNSELVQDDNLPEMTGGLDNGFG